MLLRLRFLPEPLQRWPAWQGPSISYTAVQQVKSVAGQSVSLDKLGWFLFCGFSFQSETWLNWQHVPKVRFRSHQESEPPAARVYVNAIYSDATETTNLRR